MALYEQIYEDILNKIKTGYYKIDDFLPPESEMEKIYRVSRAPVRQALNKLETLNLISRERGKGTRIIKSVVADYKIALSGFSDQLIAMRNEAVVKTLDVKEVIPPDYIQKILRIDDNTPAVNTTRLRTIGGEPVFILEHYCPYIDIEKVKEEKDIFAMRPILIDKFGFDIKYVSEEISAECPSDRISGILKVKTGYPVLKVMRISYDPDYLPIEYIEYYVKDWKYKVMYGQRDEEIL